MFNRNGSNLLKYNLEQGKDIIQYNKDITEIEEPQLSLIERGSIIEGLKGLFKSNLAEGKEIIEVDKQTTDEMKHTLSLIGKGSIVESLNNISASKSDKQQIEGLNNIDNEYNQLLAQYTQTYKQFSQELMESTQNLDPVKQYLGKNIKSSDGTIVYVNNFGFYNWYSPSAWNNGKPPGCPSSYEELNGDIPSQLTKGPNMVTGQPCGLAGKVVKNTNTNETAWIDIKGYKHIFTDEKSNSCSEQNVIKLNKNDYNLIPSGDSMKKTDYCLAMNINPTLYSKLQKLNHQIQSKGNELVKEMNSLNLQNSQAQNTINNKKNTMMKQLNQMKTNNKNLLKNKNLGHQFIF